MDNPSQLAKSTTVIVIDDDPAIGTLLRKILDTGMTERVEVEVLSDAEKLDRQLWEKSPCIVLSDVDMPGFNGFEVLKRAKEINPLNQVVLLTAHQSSEALFSGIRMGVNDFLFKPLERNSVLEVTESVIRRLTRWVAQLKQNSLTQHTTG